MEQVASDGAPWPLSLFVREFPEIYVEDKTAKGETGPDKDPASQEPQEGVDHASDAAAEGTAEGGNGEDGAAEEKEATPPIQGDPYGYRARLERIHGEVRC